MIGAKKSDKKAFMFLIAMRSNFPRKTRKRHNKIIMMLKLFLGFKDLLFDGFPETILSHSLNTN
jgi:hypothetical protein